MGSHDFLPTFSMALYHKRGVKSGFTFMLLFVMLSSDGLGGVYKHVRGGILSKYSPETVCLSKIQ